MKRLTLRKVFGAHPRSRGENLIQCDLYPLDTGSSPLTRGKQEPCGKRRPYVRLIPAHAGKTRWWSGATHWWPAHPRSRGENTCSWRVISRRVGSSPLTRGKHRPQARQLQRRGLIPAHAGKTLQRPEECARIAAHPRSRGENSPPSRIDAGHAGSSPLTRGKH